ncbi:MAG: NAD-dependent epimerase/dehydratase family protein [Lysobacteraceae bacterium]|nr:MAG: NAD-dependent epimerase/dehydratase family protein [Xanthomonadaceae bacterium]
MNDRNSRIVITGAAGLVGQNLVVELESQGYTNLLCIDKHGYNLGILESLHPGIQTLHADLAESGTWEQALRGADCVILLHAQITGKHAATFVRNSIEATARVLDACRAASVPFLVHVSSSVVNSAADDDYTRTKRLQEQMVVGAGLAHCVLRPTLMFGWFDPKHLGWLSRFMARSPVFPIPGDGRYMRQPLYERDFCRCIVDCMQRRPQGAVFDIVGDTRIDYVDIIRTIKRVLELRTLLVHIPIGLFSALLRTYALFSRKPPFTADQLKALTAGDDFTGVDTQATFNVRQTPFEDAMRETFRDPRYAGVVLRR